MLQKIGYMEEDNIIEKKPWRGIPPEYTDRWREIYNNAAPEEGMHLSDACPVCGDTELYRYYSLLKTQPRLLGGIMYKGPEVIGNGVGLVVPMNICQAMYQYRGLWSYQE